MHPTSCQNKQSPSNSRRTPLGLAALSLAALCLSACKDSVVPAVPTHLDFVVEPSSAGVGQVIAPSVVVTVRADDGNTAWEWTDDVTLSLESESGDAELQGLCSTPPVGGTAIFEDLSLDVAAEGYQLVATSGDLETALSQPFSVHDAFNAASISAGWYHTCALDEDGAAWCWGGNRYGELGDGTSTPSSVPVPVDTEIRFTSLWAGASHTCGLTSEGSAHCWGLNVSGQLGDGGQTDSQRPTQVQTGEEFVSLGTGWTHTCGVTGTGQIECWGNNYYGQVGDGTTDTERSAPTAVGGAEQFVSVSAGFYHSCGLTTDGRALCWGRNAYGEVGDGTQEVRSVPTQVAGDLRFTSLSAGGSGCHFHTCGVTTDGNTFCWGRNYQRNVSSSEIFLLTPTPLVNDPGLETVQVGSNVVCGITGGGDLYCWGTGYYGQVGNGSTEATLLPVHIRPDLSFRSFSAGRYHTCAVTVEGPAYCWGRNTDGQLGNESTGQGWTVPVPVWKPAG